MINLWFFENRALQNSIMFTSGHWTWPGVLFYKCKQKRVCDREVLSMRDVFDDTDDDYFEQQLPKNRHRVLTPIHKRPNSTHIQLKTAHWCKILISISKTRTIATSLFECYTNILLIYLHLITTLTFYLFYVNHCSSRSNRMMYQMRRPIWHPIIKGTCVCSTKHFTSVDGWWLMYKDVVSGLLRRWHHWWSCVFGCCVACLEFSSNFGQGNPVTACVPPEIEDSTVCHLFSGRLTSDLI